MHRRLASLLLLVPLTGCTHFCSWLPQVNQDVVISAMWDARGQGYTKNGVLGSLLTQVGTGNVYGASAAQQAECIGHLADQVWP